MSADVHLAPPARPVGAGPVPRPPGPGPTKVVRCSLAAGAAAVFLLTMVVFPGATEGVITGATLVGFGLGWATLAILSARTGRPQRWAAVPAVAMTGIGAALMVSSPSDHTLAVLTWMWPPVTLALAAWTYLRARRNLDRPSRLLVAAVLTPLAAVSVAAVFANDSSRSFADTYPAPGTRHTVGDHALHLDCRGPHTGPTVVLFSGLGEFSASWARITDPLTATTRVCAYDRAGQGWSDDLDHPQDGIDAAADLHALLDAAGETGPFVLAGHSIGGPYAMTYAAQYPDDVAGVALLDSTSPQQFDVIPAYPLQNAFMRRFYGVLPSLARAGLGPLLAGSHLPAAAAAPVDAMAATPRAARNARDELATLPDLLQQAQALTSLDDRPLVVLTSADNARSSEGWTQAQQQMATLSTNAVHDDVEATHAGMLEDPAGAAASVQAIASVVDAVRTHTPLPAS